MRPEKLRKSFARVEQGKMKPHDRQTKIEVVVRLHPNEKRGKNRLPVGPNKSEGLR